MNINNHRNVRAISLNILRFNSTGLGPAKKMYMCELLNNVLLLQAIWMHKSELHELDNIANDYKGSEVSGICQRESMYSEKIL